MAKARAGSRTRRTSPKKKPASSGPGPPRPRTRGELNKRYTAADPKERPAQRAVVRASALDPALVLGLLLIVGNYVGIMPASPNNWYLIGGLVGIVVGAMMATQYH